MESEEPMKGGLGEGLWDEIGGDVGGVWAGPREELGRIDDVSAVKRRGEKRGG